MTKIPGSERDPESDPDPNPDPLVRGADPDPYQYVTDLQHSFEFDSDADPDSSPPFIVSGKTFAPFIAASR